MPRGRPAHKPSKESREIVKNLAIAGFTRPHICQALGIGSNQTLSKHYGDELREGHLLATAAVAGKLFDKCMGGDTSAMIFWMKARAGWRDRTDINHTSDDGSMTPPTTILVKGVNAGD